MNNTTDPTICPICHIDPVDVDSPTLACYTCCVEECMVEIIGISEYLVEYDD